MTSNKSLLVRSSRLEWIICKLPTEGKSLNLGTSWPTKSSLGSTNVSSMLCEFVNFDKARSKYSPFPAQKSRSFKPLLILPWSILASSTADRSFSFVYRKKVSNGVSSSLFLYSKPPELFCMFILLIIPDSAVRSTAIRTACVPRRKELLQLL